jgi:hypothetical protein
MYGRSVSNQRIEAWWSFLRKTDSDWWIKLFKDIRDACGMPEILFHEVNPRELKKVAEHWNLHRIRPCKNFDSPAGRPDVLYFLPELEETIDYSTPVPSDEIALAKELCCDQVIEQPASREFVELAHRIMHEENLTMPDDAEEALSLYIDLVYHIENI